MPIYLTCPCGKVLQVGDEMAGRQGRCPVCSRVLAIPGHGALGPSAAPPPPEPASPVTAIPGPVESGEPGSPAYAAVPLPAAPTAALPEERTGRPPAYRLFSPGQAGLAAFLGGPVGAFIILTINYFRLGKPAAAWATIAFGLLACAALIALLLVLPESIPGPVLGLPLFLGMWGLAKGLQGSAYAEHLQNGGEGSSSWAAAGFGLLGAVLFMGVFMGVFVGFDSFLLDKKVDFGGGEEVYYTKDTTEAEARALGAFLREVGFFNKSGPKSVRLSRAGNRMVVAFVVQNWVLNDAKVQQEFRTIGKQASDKAFNGRPVEVQLCDEYFQVKKKLE
jgi:hypothetical protein